jgi:DNA polymerase III delta subunit
VGPNQQMLSSELDKLQLYQPVITRATIDLLTEQTPLSSIFDLVEAAFNGHLGRALDLYQDQRAQNVEPLAIEALFVWQLHALVLCKAGSLTGKTADQIAAQSGISPYVAKKSTQLAGQRTMAQVKTYVYELAELEQALKSTSADADELMKNFILLLGQ